MFEQAMHASARSLAEEAGLRDSICNPMHIRLS